MRSQHILYSPAMFPIVSEDVGNAFMTDRMSGAASVVGGGVR